MAVAARVAAGEGEVAAATTSAEAAPNAAVSDAEPAVCARLCAEATTAEANAADDAPPPALRLLDSAAALAPATVKSTRTPAEPAAGVPAADACRMRRTAPGAR